MYAGVSVRNVRSLDDWLKRQKRRLFQAMLTKRCIHERYTWWKAHCMQIYLLYFKY